MFDGNLKVMSGAQLELRGPGPGFEPGSWDPQSQRITTTPSGPFKGRAIALHSGLVSGYKSLFPKTLSHLIE